MPVVRQPQLLARAGCKALIIEGLPKEDKWYSLALTPDGVTINEETELIGKGNFEVVETLSKRLEGKPGIITIGQAGEMKMSWCQYLHQGSGRRLTVQWPWWSWGSNGIEKNQVYHH